MSEPADRRLECLKLALQRHGANDAREPLVIANEFHAWVEGQGATASPSAGRKAAGKATS